MKTNKSEEVRFSLKESELICDLFEFADKNRVTFHPIQEILVKVRKMAADNRKCICKPDERVCPCKEAVDELKEKGRCTCWLFCTYSYGSEYLHEYSYIDDSGVVLSDDKRKKKQKLKVLGIVTK